MPALWWRIDARLPGPQAMLCTETERRDTMGRWSGEARSRRGAVPAVIIQSLLLSPASPHVDPSSHRPGRTHESSPAGSPSSSSSAAFAALILICFGEALFRGGQFGYRDAGHFYYPLYQRVQAEWDAGRWPLWEPEENAGMPLLGNPTAAVLYPGKLIYALLPYPWAARLYIIAHMVLAFVAMLLRHAVVGSELGGFGHLGARPTPSAPPILFQYCNIIYLVGAAWLPFGFLAVDRWLRRGSRWALLGLAVVLAMQTLGGDPQSSYLLGLCGGGYAAGLAWSRRGGPAPRRLSDNGPARRAHADSGG